MNAVVKGAVGLAVAVAIVSVLIPVIGLHTSPIGSLVALVLVILLNIGAVIWVLRQTRASCGYGKQLLNGLILGLVAGVLIFAFSWINLSYIFPDYLDEMRDGMIAFLESANMPEAQLEAQVDKLEQATVMSQSRNGLIGTFLTSLIVAAIAAIWIRRKD